VRFATILLVTAVVVAACTPRVLELDVGTCFDDPSTLESVSDVPLRDCSDPHDNEVIALDQMGATTYPGDDTVTSISRETCIRVFDGYMGVPYLDSPYEVGWLSPTSESWAVGDREIICFVFDPTPQKIIGSVRNGTGVSL